MTHGGVALAALIVGTGIGSSGEAGADVTVSDAEPKPTVTMTETAEAVPEPAVTVTETQTVTAKPKKPKRTKKPGPPESFGGDGEYLVGEDIAAGTYRTSGPDSEFGCYWARLRNASGEFDAIIANNNLNGPGRVTLNKGEYLKTERCQEWKKVG
ncbi:hypothetical protein J7E91_11275 [Streptomyces sp. ISL-99]|nr:hypothetical protein [Streptomyces sp. ISL-99]